MKLMNEVNGIPSSEEVPTIKPVIVPAVTIKNKIIENKLKKSSQFFIFSIGPST